MLLKRTPARREGKAGAKWTIDKRLPSSSMSDASATTSMSSHSSPVASLMRDFSGSSTCSASSVMPNLPPHPLRKKKKVVSLREMEGWIIQDEALAVEDVKTSELWTSDIALCKNLSGAEANGIAAKIAGHNYATAMDIVHGVNFSLLDELYSKLDLKYLDDIEANLDLEVQAAFNSEPFPPFQAEAFQRTCGQSQQIFSLDNPTIPFNSISDRMQPQLSSTGSASSQHIEHMISDAANPRPSTPAFNSIEEFNPVATHRRVRESPVEVPFTDLAPIVEEPLREEAVSGDNGAQPPDGGGLPSGSSQVIDDESQNNLQRSGKTICKLLKAMMKYIRSFWRKFCSGEGMRLITEDIPKAVSWFYKILCKILRIEKDGSQDQESPRVTLAERLKSGWKKYVWKWLEPTLSCLFTALCGQSPKSTPPQYPELHIGLLPPVISQINQGSQFSSENSSDDGDSLQSRSGRVHLHTEASSPSVMTADAIYQAADGSWKMGTYTAILRRGQCSRPRNRSVEDLPPNDSQGSGSDHHSRPAKGKAKDKDQPSDEIQRGGSGQGSSQGGSQANLTYVLSAQRPENGKCGARNENHDISHRGVSQQQEDNTSDQSPSSGRGHDTDSTQDTPPEDRPTRPKAFWFTSRQGRNNHERYKQAQLTGINFPINERILTVKNRRIVECSPVRRSGGSRACPFANQPYGETNTQGESSAPRPGLETLTVGGQTEAPSAPSPISQSPIAQSSAAVAKSDPRSIAALSPEAIDSSCDEPRLEFVPAGDPREGIMRKLWNKMWVPVVFSSASSAAVSSHRSSETSSITSTEPSPQGLSSRIDIQQFTFRRSKSAPAKVSCSKTNVLGHAWHNSPHRNVSPSSEGNMDSSSESDKSTITPESYLEAVREILQESSHNASRRHTLTKITRPALRALPITSRLRSLLMIHKAQVV